MSESCLLWPLDGVLIINFGGGVPLGHKNLYPEQDQEILILQACSRLNIKQSDPVPD